MRWRRHDSSSCARFPALKSSYGQLQEHWENCSMPKTKPPAPPLGNRLLARLPRKEFQRLLPQLQFVPLAVKHVLYEARAHIDYAYLPIRGVVSVLTVMEDGRAIEVA